MCLCVFVQFSLSIYLSLYRSHSLCLFLSLSIVSVGSYLVMEVGGTASGDFDRISVEGHAALGGTMVVEVCVCVYAVCYIVVCVYVLIRSFSYHILASPLSPLDSHNSNQIRRSTATL